MKKKSQKRTQPEGDPHRYDDMLYLPRHVSKNHPQMPIYKRAAQFAPFAALSGHAAAVKEAERLTETERELDEYERAMLDRRMQQILAAPELRRHVTITYFRKDERKEGGAYIDVTGEILKIDYNRKVIRMRESADGAGVTEIEFCHVSDIRLPEA